MPTTLRAHALVLQNQQSTMPVLALPEIAGAIARRTDAHPLAVAVVTFLGTLAWLKFVPIDESLAHAATDTAIRQQLRGADAVYVAPASQPDGMLITLDRAMRERAPTSVTTCTPLDWLKHA